LSEKQRISQALTTKATFPLHPFPLNPSLGRGEFVFCLGDDLEIGEKSDHDGTDQSTGSLPSSCSAEFTLEKTLEPINLATESGDG
jgi:hypothetical protein